MGFEVVDVNSVNVPSVNNITPGSQWVVLHTSAGVFKIRPEALTGQLGAVVQYLTELAVSSSNSTNALAYVDAIKTRVTALESLINAAADGDAIVNTYTEILSAMASFPEGVSVLTEFQSRYTIPESNQKYGLAYMGDQGAGAYDGSSWGQDGNKLFSIPSFGSMTITANTVFSDTLLSNFPNPNLKRQTILMIENVSASNVTVSSDQSSVYFNEAEVYTLAPQQKLLLFRTLVDGTVQTGFRVHYNVLGPFGTANVGGGGIPEPVGLGAYLRGGNAWVEGVAKAAFDAAIALLQNSKTDKYISRVFSQTVVLDRPFISIANQVGNIYLDIDITNSVAGTDCILQITGDGSTGSLASMFGTSTKLVSANGVSFKNDAINEISIRYTGGNFAFYNILRSEAPDFDAPVVEAAYTNVTGTQINVFFVKRIIGTANFTVTGKSITSQSLSSDKSVLITLSTPIISGESIVLNGGNTITSTGSTAMIPLSSYPVTNNAGLIMQDLFSNADITNIAGRATPVGGFGWVKYGVGSGTMGIVTGAIKALGTLANVDFGYMVSTGSRGKQRYVIKTMGTAGNNNINISYTSGTPLTQLYLSLNGQIRQHISGTNSLVVATGATFASGDIIDVEYTVARLVTIRKNGVLITPAFTANAAHTGNTFGVYIYQDLVMEWESVEQYAI